MLVVAKQKRIGEEKEGLASVEYKFVDTHLS